MTFILHQKKEKPMFKSAKEHVLLSLGRRSSDKFVRMVSWDYYVGFEREPELNGLESFLKKEGYIRTKKTKNSIDYESENELVELSYYPKAEQVEPGEEPDWEEAGFNVISEVTVTTKEDDEEALRISEKLAKKYDAIFYDPSGEDFFRKSDL